MQVIVQVLYQGLCYDRGGKDRDERTYYLDGGMNSQQELKIRMVRVNDCCMG